MKNTKDIMQTVGLSFLGTIFLATAGAVLSWKVSSDVTFWVIFVLEYIWCMQFVWRHQKKKNEIIFREKRIRMLKHDLEDRIFCMNHLFVSGNIEEAKEMILDMNAEYRMHDMDDICKDCMLDALLKKWVYICKEKHIALHLDIEAEEKIRIDKSDMCKIISNLLKNAVEATCRNQDFQWIDFKLKQSDKALQIACRNSVSEQEKHSEHRKEADRGYGLQILNHVIEKYDGIMNVLKKKEEYVTMIEIEYE